MPYLGVWVARRAASSPGPWSAVALGLVATVYLVDTYVLAVPRPDPQFVVPFAHRPTARWGHLLGFILFTPYRWWQRQHSLHHANSGNLDKRGPGEIYTMTVAEYEAASLCLAIRSAPHRIIRTPS